MESLKAMTAKLGAPKLEGNEAVGGKDAPALYFGKTKINNNFDIVDTIGKEDGKGMTATLFAKGGVSTSVPKPDGSGRAVGLVWQDRRWSPSKQAKRTTAKWQF
jgi:hypothetical protein